MSLSGYVSQREKKGAANWIIKWREGGWGYGESNYLYRREKQVNYLPRNIEGIVGKGPR